MRTDTIDPARHRPLRRVTRLALVAAYAAAIATSIACSTDVPTAAGVGHDDRGLETPVVRRVELTGLPDSLGAGDVAGFAVRVLGDSGRELPGRAVSLASSAPGVALVDPSGRVRAVSAGAATISATVDGVVGATRVVVTADTPDLPLHELDGAIAPVLVDAHLAADGVVEEFRELYVETGRLELTGGERPTYRTTLHYAWYAVDVDSAGQRHLLLRKTLDTRDEGLVAYDAHGDLVMTSTAQPGLSHTARAVSGGFDMTYHSGGASGSIALFFRREPRWR